MSGVLVLWEDQYYEKLDLCLRRALRHLGLRVTALHSLNCRGNGGFGPYIARAWPIAARHGLANRSHGAIDHVVCVADADRAHECCDVANPMTVAGPTAEWLERADQAWTTKLRAAAPLAPERVHARFLRWSQESLLIAAHDVEPMLATLGCGDRSRIARHLAACNPSPLRTADAEFVDRFRKPERCLEDMLKAAGIRVPKKGVTRSDALDVASAHAIDRLCARTPDLPALARRISELSAVPRGAE